MQAAGTYLASLPTGDKYTRATSGVENNYAPAKQAASERFSESQKNYAEAISRSGDKPAPVAQERPSWAEGAGYGDAATPAPASASASAPDGPKWRYQKPHSNPQNGYVAGGWRIDPNSPAPKTSNLSRPWSS
jgi:hypothetical protein